MSGGAFIEMRWWRAFLRHAAAVKTMASVIRPWWQAGVNCPLGSCLVIPKVHPGAGPGGSGVRRDRAGPRGVVTRSRDSPGQKWCGEAGVARRVRSAGATVTGGTLSLEVVPSGRFTMASGVMFLNRETESSLN